MTTTPEPTDEAEEEHFCQACRAKRMAFDVLTAGVMNALAAGVEPGEIDGHVCAILDEIFGDADEDVGEITAETPTAGRA